MSTSELFEVEDHVLEEVAKTFGRTVKSLNEDVEVLQEWMRNQAHLPEIMDHKMLQNFLIMNKCSIGNTKKKIDMYYTVRSILDVFQEINPKLPNTQNVMEAIYLVPLPKLTPEMYRVLVAKVRDRDLAAKLEPLDAMRHLINTIELRLMEDVAFGDVVIMDWSGASTNFLMKLTPTFMYNLIVTFYEKVLSARLKNAYILNAPPLFKTVMAIMKKLVKPKLFERILICQDSKILFEKFPRSIIPKDFGGEGKSLEEVTKTLAEKFTEYEKRFHQLDILRTNESLRPEKLENDEILGFYGNFKTLDVD